MAARNAANVLPEPVGAAISALRPAWMSGHARCCGSVGSRKRDSNQRSMAGWKTGKDILKNGGDLSKEGHPPRRRGAVHRLPHLVVLRRRAPPHTPPERAAPQPP